MQTSQKNSFPLTLTLTDESFLREMPYSSLRLIENDLNIHNGWEQVAEKIPVKADSIFSDADFIPRYTSQNMMSFAAKNQCPGQSAAKALLNDWKTKNVKIKHLVAILHQCRFWRLTNFIEKDVLGKSYMSRNAAFLLRALGKTSQEPEIVFARNLLQEVCTNPNPDLAAALLKQNNLADFSPPTGDGASGAGTKEQKLSHVSESTSNGAVEAGAATPISHSKEISDVAANLLARLSAGDEVMAVQDKETTDNLHLLKNINFQILQKITNNFDGRHMSEGGTVLGEGGFGTVHLGTFHWGLMVAVKCLKEHSSTQDQFKTEVDTLCAFKHPNVVRLLGYSIHEEKRCLVYQYMPNGSLEDRLGCCHNTPPLSIPLRLDIVKGTARGIAFLNQGGLIHRDIKSGNILLDKDFTPKIADFATARIAASDKAFDLTASVVIGSPAYMAPEAINFKINPKLDSFSFGVVLLEMLTGLPILDSDREEQDLKCHVKEHCTPPEDDNDDEEAGSIFDLLDVKVGEWDHGIVNILYNVSQRCLNVNPRQRPTVADILPELEAMGLNDKGTS